MVVAAPLWHYSMGPAYAYAFIVPVYLHGVADLLGGLVYSGYHFVVVTEEDAFLASNTCYGGESRHTSHHTYRDKLILNSATLSVVLLLLVYVVYKRRQQPNGLGGKSTQVAPNEPAAAAAAGSSESQQRLQSMRRERKLLHSVLVSGMCTLCIYVVPLQVAMSELMSTSVFVLQISASLWVLSNLNPIMNFFIFLTRHKELRIGLRAVLKCKTLGPNIQHWT